MRITSAVLTCTQVVVIQKLFNDFGREFHIQPESIRGFDNVWVEVYSNVIGFGGGWNPIESKASGFDSFFDSCHEELTKRFKLVG